MSYNIEEWGGLNVYVGSTYAGRIQKVYPQHVATDKHPELTPTYSNTRVEAPLLYKRHTNGNLMIMKIWLDEQNNIKSTIDETGKATRSFTSPIKVPLSKTLCQKAMEQVISKWNKKSGRDDWSPKEGGDQPKYFEPMLLHRYDKYYRRIGEWPVIVQPKLDGVRGTYYVAHEEVVSRKRDPFPLPHIVQQMRRLGVSGDGELYAHGYPHEEITGAVTRSEMKDSSSTLDKRAIEFHLFDRTDMEDAPFEERYASLFDLDLSETPHIRIVPCVLAQSHDEIREYMKLFREQGYEGGVVRTRSGKYQKNKRVYHTLKVKPVFDDEFEITDVVYDLDAKFGELIAFMCKAKNGEPFKVTPAWGKKTRAEAYKFSNHAVEYIGKPLTVEYRETTKYGVPRHAVGIRVRSNV